MILFKRKIRANALQFSMLISVVVLLLISSALLLYQHQKENKQRISLYHTQARTVNHLMLSSYTYEQLQKPYYSEEAVVKAKSYWGAYRLIMTSYITEQFSMVKGGLFGTNPEINYNPILYLEDNGMPLVIAGSSSLKGKVNLPSGYIKQGSINGSYFQGTLEINPITSSNSLPALDPNWIQYVDSILNKDYLFSTSSPPKDCLIKSFKDPVSTFVSFKEFQNEANVLIGNQILFDPEHITIKDYMDLDNIVIISPSVCISNGFSGSIHVISNNIKVESNVDLLFPSSLISQNRKDQVNKESNISIARDSRIKGNIIFLNKKNNLEKVSNINISPGVDIKGNIYCQGYLNFQGSLEGTIYSKFLLTESQGGKYINHLFNGDIESVKNDDNYVGLPLLESNYALASWVF